MQQSMQYSVATPQEVFAEMQEDSVFLVDVRQPEEFRGKSPRGAVNIPLEQLNKSSLEKNLGSGILSRDIVYFICRSGNRSGMACEKIAKEGGTAINVAGGLLAWEEAGLPCNGAQSKD